MIICIEVSKGDNLKLSVGSDHRWEQCHQDRDYPNLKWIVRHMIFSNLSKSNLFVDRVWLPSMSMTQLIESNLSSKAYKSPQPAFFFGHFYLCRMIILPWNRPKGGHIVAPKSKYFHIFIFLYSPILSWVFPDPSQTLGSSASLSFSWFRVW